MIYPEPTEEEMEKDEIEYNIFIKKEAKKRNLSIKETERQLDAETDKHAERWQREGQLLFLEGLQKAVSGGKTANDIIKRVNKFFNKKGIDGIARRLEDDNGKITKGVEIISEDDLLPYQWAMRFGGYTEVDESNGFHSEAEMGVILNVYDER